MMRFLYLVAIVITLLNARENPFFPIDKKNDLSYTTNQVQPPKPFHKQAITLPSSARILQSVIIEYKNLDGSIVQKKVPIN